jgi:hypothetical protein
MSISQIVTSSGDLKFSKSVRAFREGEKKRIPVDGGPGRTYAKDVFRAGNESGQMVGRRVRLTTADGDHGTSGKGTPLADVRR